MNYCPQCRNELRYRKIDSIERLACSSEFCKFIYWENPTPVVAGLVQVADKFVIARNASWPNGMFSLITGFLEKGENPEAAIARETNEELGLTANRVSFIGHFSIPEFNQLVIAFHVNAIGKISPNEELSEVLALSIEELERYDFGPLKTTQEIVQNALTPNLINKKPDEFEKTKCQNA